MDPILDTLFVGRTADPRTATYLDAAGDTQPVTQLRWYSDNASVFTVDSVSGAIGAVGPGSAVLRARANGVTGSALIVVTRTLDLALLLDTIYLMPGDTFRIPVAVRDTDGVPPPVWFFAPTNALFDLDSASGLITAAAAGAPVAFTAYADTVTASGSIEVVQLTDTVGGKGYFTIFGTVIRRAKRTARAVNYRRDGDTATFRLALPLGSPVVENLVITLRDSVAAPGTLAIDSISIAEAFGSADFICRPTRSWAAWSLETAAPIYGLSRRFGTIAITQVDTLTNGLAVSGRFTFTAQRVDLYDDPLGALPILGTFVAPLTADPRPCRS
ncbi:MAG: hypothetical protein Q8Q14_00270 [Gemmatimonadales bacterium]|nr:hypothetical protein [Gemmatimonadales bacterium]